MIKPVAAYQIREERCLIFPWADGGNLGNYWENYGRKPPELRSLQWIIYQFVGICSALEELHDSNCRHGDLKPENILWFKDDEDRGTLQIADLGLAAFHEKDAHTNVRLGKDKLTSTPSGTSRYEPPEMDKDREKRDAQEARSRQYDIWSMGCIMLELLIWLTYGYQAVETFRKNTDYFWELQEGNGYAVHHYVTSRMSIMDTQLQDSTAYKELLHLVRARLLVVKVSQTYKSQLEFREIAKVLHASIKAIQQKCQSEPSYLLPLQLKYSSDETKENVPQPGIVYQNEFGLATPTQKDAPTAPRAPHTSLSSHISDPEEDFDPRILVRAPTFPTPDTRETSRVSDHQGVGELSHLKNHEFTGLTYGVLLVRRCSLFN